MHKSNVAALLRSRVNRDLHAVDAAPTRLLICAQAMICLLKAYKEANGHVNVPLDHTAELEGREKPVRLGRWLAAVRKNAAKVKPERVAALDAVDPKWRGD